MKKNAVTKKIGLLKEIKPNPDWLKSQRSNLLLEIESGKEARRAWDLPGFFAPNFSKIFAQPVFRPVAVSFLALCLILSGGLVTVQAAKNSSPGDLLYPVKITLHQVKTSISSQANKPKLQAELVGYRIQELAKIIEESNSAEKEDRVLKLTDKIQAQVVNTKAQFDKTVKETVPEKAAEVANLVSAKTVEAEKALTEAKEKIVEEFKEEPEKITHAIEAFNSALNTVALVREDMEKTRQEIEIRMEVKNMENPFNVEEPIVTSPTTELKETSTSFDDLNE